MGLTAPWHVGSSRTRAQTRVPCTGRWILNHCTTREVLICLFLSLFDSQLSEFPGRFCPIMSVTLQPPTLAEVQLSQIFLLSSNHPSTFQLPGLCYCSHLSFPSSPCGFIPLKEILNYLFGGDSERGSVCCPYGGKAQAHLPFGTFPNLCPTTWHRELTTPSFVWVTPRP